MRGADRKNQQDRIYLLPGDPPIEVTFRRSPRAQRFSLRVSRSDGRASLSLPVWADEDEALAFLEAREDWLRAHVAAAPAAKRPEIGGTLPLGGKDIPITPGKGRAAKLIDGAVTVPDGPRVGPRVKALLVTLARARLADAVDLHSATLGRAAGRITLRDPRSRWGSCSAKGDLMFSWRLIMAPDDILDYVVAHEVAHLVEMNHSDRFWAVCAQLCPDYRTHRRWLRTHGPGLLAWRFDTEL